MRRTVVSLAGAVKGWRYEKCGLPANVLRAAQWNSRAPGEGEVVVRMTAAPVLSDDVKMVMGVLGGQQAEAYPATGGTSGVGEVERVGPGVVGIAKGAKVLLSSNTVGSWATEVTTDSANLHNVSSVSLPAHHLALLPLYAGAEVMATAHGNVANKTVWVLGADLPQGAALAESLTTKGASVVAVKKGDAIGSIQSKPAYVRYIFNGIGGATLAEAINKAEEGATVVTFDDAGERMDIDADTLLSKRVALRSFWFNRWASESTPAEQNSIYSAAAPLAAKSSIPSKQYKLADFEQAFDSVYAKAALPVIAF